MMSFRSRKALALLVHTVREDWGQEGILDALGRLIEAEPRLPVDEVSRIALRASQDARNRTPAVIALPGPHRDVVREPLATTQPFSRSRTCDTCGKSEDWCRRVTRPDDHEFVSIEDARAREATPR